MLLKFLRLFPQPQNAERGFIKCGYKISCVGNIVTNSLHMLSVSNDCTLDYPQSHKETCSDSLDLVLLDHASA